MKQNPKAKLQSATVAAIVVGLSATGAVYFSLGDAHAASAVSAAADQGGRSGVKRQLPRTVERDLRVRREAIKFRRDGVEFVSRAYADALNTDRESVVRALSQKYAWIDPRRITVRGNRIFIGSSSGGAEAAKNIFENLCLVLKFNIKCKKEEH